MFVMKEKVGSTEAFQRLPTQTKNRKAILFFYGIFTKQKVIA